MANSAVKVALIGLACLYAAGDVRRRRGLVVAVIAAHVVLVVAVGLMLAFADTSAHCAVGGAWRSTPRSRSASGRSCGWRISRARRPMRRR